MNRLALSVKCSWCRQMHQVSINSGYGSGGSGNAFWANEFVCMEKSMGMGELRPHHTDQDGERDRQRKRKRGGGRESQKTGEDSYKPWSDFGGQRPPPSCHFSYMQ